MLLSYLKVTTISLLLMSTCSASDISKDTTQSDPGKQAFSSEEILNTAENVVFRPYFQHPSHHHHHHHHTHTQPPVVLESVNPGTDAALQSNLVRRSYSVLPAWYATGPPPTGAYYYSAVQPRNCYCYPQTTYQKADSRYYPDYYNRIPNYYSNYYKQYSRR